ncbi:hypothetical protein CPter291_2926 [Collimonas pratensis]|uniref:Uncharacterized protein n=1 Tax=Collimonas pratensis TaxID=279113 RepID=A0ABM5Z847_9BURK|nr:hypothetical protein CPter291_2926 [Collimonas pratensis]
MPLPPPPAPVPPPPAPAPAPPVPCVTPAPEPNDFPRSPPLEQPASKLVSNKDAATRPVFCDVFMMYFPFVKVRTTCSCMYISQGACQQENIGIKGKTRTALLRGKRDKFFKINHINFFRPETRKT